MRTPKFIIIFFFLLAFFSKPVFAAPAKNFIDNFDRYVETVRTTWAVPGIAVAVVEDGEVVLMKGYGVRDLNSGGKVSEHTVFQLASLSKTFTATMMGMLAERDYLSLNDRICKYKKDLLLGTPEQTDKITLKNILSHTCGFPSHAGDPRIEGGESFDTVIGSFKTLKVLYEPGKVYDYQNAIYALSGEVIEKITGDSFADSLTNNLLIPLGMEDASVGLAGLNTASNKASPHRYRSGVQTPVKFSTNYYSVLPAAGVNASIADMTQWLRLHLGDFSESKEGSAVLIGKKTLDELHNGVVATPGETWRMRAFKERITDTSYGLGWRNYNYAGHKIVTHGGMLSGFNSLVAFAPDKKTGIVVLSNSSGSPAVGVIRSAFFDRLFDLDTRDWNQALKDEETKAIAKQAARKTKKAQKKRVSRKI